MKVELQNLPETITAPRTDPIYNCHGYLTKVPVAAIEPFIQTFSRPGEIVADIFAGSGMTGLAALRQQRGARLSDISVLGQHIAQGYLTAVNEDRLREAGEAAVKAARRALGNLYSAQRSEDGVTMEMVRTVWSFTYECRNCSTELVFFNIAGKPSGEASCAKCGEPFIKRKWKHKRDVPVEVVLRDAKGRLKTQAPTAFDATLIAKALKDKRQSEIPSLEIGKDREMFGRSGLGKAGLTETARFFSSRNAIALLELWRAIGNEPDAELQKKLQFAFTAILPRASRRYQWSAQRPLNAQNQTYYIAPVYYEWNVFELFERKMEAAMRSDGALMGELPLLQGGTRDVRYDLASADNLTHLTANSIDYVFTDPPFGSNIFYSDMNLFHEAWLGRTTDCALEAVVHTSGSKKAGAAGRYELLLTRAFAEAYRVLKPGRYMSVVFGNSNGRIWGLVQRAIREAGFDSAPSHVAILDKGQRSVKGLNSGTEGVVTVDLILTVQKPEAGTRTANVHVARGNDSYVLIREVVSELAGEKAINPSHVYARVLQRAIIKHYALDELHLSDVLLALRTSGYTIDPKSGRLTTHKAIKRDQMRRVA